MNALANLNIVWVGEILLAENLAALGVFSRPTLRNVGAKSGIELKLFLEEHELSLIKVSDWPSLEEIEELILSRNLRVGRKFAQRLPIVTRLRTRLPQS